MHLRLGSKSLGEPPPNYSVPRSLQDSRRCISQRVIALKDEGTHPRFLPRAGRTFTCPTSRSTRSMGPAESHFVLHLHSLHPPRLPIITVQITLWSALGNRFQYARPTFNLDIDGTAFIDISSFSSCSPLFAFRWAHPHHRTCMELAHKRSPSYSDAPVAVRQPSVPILR